MTEDENDFTAERVAVHPADPPIPVPIHLRPDHGLATTSNDLRIAISTEELHEIDRLLVADGVRDRQMLLTQREGSPWLEIDIAEVPMRRYALWRYTCALYRVGPHGAIDDDPIQRPGDDRSVSLTAVMAVLREAAGDHDRKRHPSKLHPMHEAADLLERTYQSVGEHAMTKT